MPDFYFASPSLGADMEEADVIYLARGGFQQRLDGHAVDHIADIEEAVVGHWLGQTPDTSLIHQLNQLDALAQQVVKPSHPAHYNLGQWPYVAVHAEHEGSAANTRYALLKRAWVPKMPSEWYGSQDAVRLVVKYIREGTWRDRTPGFTPKSFTGSPFTIQQHDHSTSQHYIDITTSMVEGDAPTPLDVRVELATPGGEVLWDQVMLALRAKPPGGWTNMDYYYFADSAFSVSKGSVVAATGDAVPGSQMWRWASSDPAGTIGTITWKITTLDPSDLWGRYAVYLIGRESTSADEFSLTLRHGLDAGYSVDVGGDQYVPAWGGGVQWRVVNIGTITVPPFGAVPGAAAVGDYYFQVWAEKQSGAFAGLDVAGITLVPIEAGGFVFTVDNIGSEGVRMDSDSRRAWGYTVSTLDLTGPNVKPHGRFPRLVPGTDYRLFVYNHKTVYESNRDLKVYLAQVPMYWNVM